MKFADFILAIGLENISISCEKCPLREQCRADEAKREELALEPENCSDFLKRMLTE